jgi:hypothetical protein
MVFPITGNTMALFRLPLRAHAKAKRTGLTDQKSITRLTLHEFPPQIILPSKFIPALAEWSTGIDHSLEPAPRKSSLIPHLSHFTSMGTRVADFQRHGEHAAPQTH